MSCSYKELFLLRCSVRLLVDTWSISQEGLSDLRVLCSEGRTSEAVRLMSKLRRVTATEQVLLILLMSLNKLLCSLHYLRGLGGGGKGVDLKGCLAL